VALWRGYKKYAVDLAAKVRCRLGVSLYESLDVRQLAALYELPIVSFDQLPAAPEAVRYYTETHWTQLSGLVVPVNGQQVILINPAHCDDRIVSTIGHEVAHVILCHESRVRLTGEKDCRAGDEEQEDEANWLGGELLLPREAARRLVFREVDEVSAAAAFGVSVAMARWRMNICGGRQMLQRSR